MSSEEERNKELEKLDAKILKEMDKEEKKKKKDDKMIKHKKKYTSLQKFRDKSIIGLAVAGAILLLWPRVYFVLRGMSLVFFLMGIVAQTFTQFAQITIFIFFVGMIAGIVIHFVED